MCSKTTLEPLIKKQNDIVSVLTPLSIDENYYLHRIIKLENIFRYEMAKFIFRHKNKLLSNSLQRLMRTTEHKYETRNSTVPSISRHNYKIYNTSFLCKSVMEWQKLPMDCLNEEN